MHGEEIDPDAAASKAAAKLQKKMALTMISLNAVDADVEAGVDAKNAMQRNFQQIIRMPKHRILNSLSSLSSLMAMKSSRMTARLCRKNRRGLNVPDAENSPPNRQPPDSQMML